MTVVLDGGQIATREELHNALEQGLALPEWYGRNLDALYDCLCDMGEETEIVLRGLPLLRETLGSYAETLLRVLRDAGEENERLTITVEDSTVDSPTVEDPTAEDPTVDNPEGDP